MQTIWVAYIHSPYGDCHPKAVSSTKDDAERICGDDVWCSVEGFDLDAEGDE